MADPAIDATKPTTAEPPVLSPQEMSNQQLHEFFAKGTRFDKTDPAADDDPPPAGKTADSAPADAVDPAASTDATSPAASETATPEKPKKGKGLKARVEQLDQENDGLSQRLSAALRRRRELHEQLADAEREPSKPKADVKPGSSPATADKPTDANWKRFRTMDGAPKVEDFTGDTALEDFVEAKAAFIAEKLADEKFAALYDERTRQSEAERQQQREFSEAAERAEERAKADEARHPDWRTQLDPVLAKIPPARALPPGVAPNAMNFIKDQVMFEADHPVSLMVFLSTDEGKQWAFGLTKMRPERIVREIAIKDASFAADPDDDTHPSHVSKAPPPGQTLGRKPSAPVDPLKAAQESGNVEDFINQRNKQLVGAGSR